jgi:hypothetical protein
MLASSPETMRYASSGSSWVGRLSSRVRWLACSRTYERKLASEIILTLVSVIADEEGHAARPVSRLRDEPGRCSPELPVVGPNKASAVAGGLIRDIGDDWLPLHLERLDRLAHERMVRRDH